ncbi:divalent metal cation transporter [Anaerobaca lacustris]|uniref:Divalent metal cation transporter n=1 Tax=Anaerobaca lacustris TaxID=3044600 RepID=A0AAW6TSW5_9BACT|nr:divalent metal cation transporter [Sedimentisphaerales bacterium M17dextr]
MASNDGGGAASKPQQPVMHMNPRIEKDRQMILDAKAKGRGPLLKVFMRLSGPGWLQSGITLGGGSLSSSLYLGVLVGFSFMWLQPLAMILGVIMLCAIAYVTLSTGERPLRGINEHVSPVLGWGWLLASMMANLVWSLPQFALGTAAIRQNLLPGLIGPGVMGEIPGKMIAGALFLVIALTATLTYSAGGRGVKVFEIMIKGIVSLIVLCFIGVVVKVSMDGRINWGEIGSGLIPDLSLFMKPTDKIMPHIQLVGEGFRSFWTDMIVGQQRDVMISAAATAVGINMTFLLPYSMLRKGWDKDFRGLAIFDLSTGLFIPFILATGCVVIAASSQFHAQPAQGLVANEPGGLVIEEPAANLVGPYKGLLADRVRYEMGVEAFDKLTPEQVTAATEALPWADKRMAAILVKRDAFNLAETLAPLTGPVVAQYVFGIGVIGMALSAATMLMTINGLCFCELLNKPARGWPQRFGSLMVCVGALGPFFWKDAAPYLAVPTSVFAMVLLPIAYFAFFFLMNQESYLGKYRPRGGKRVLWNVLMALAAGAAAFGSVWSLWSRLQWMGIILLVVFIVVVVVVRYARADKKGSAVA